MSNATEFHLDADGIATLTIDVKDKPMNVLTPELITDLTDFAAKLASDDAIKGGIIASGKSSFVAGADLKEIVAIYDLQLPVDKVWAISRNFTEPLRQLETCGKPIVAAINGTALGGGLEICLACHHRVAADNPKAVLGLPEVTVGLLPGAGGTQRLPRMIGVQPALELMTSGKHVDVHKALKLGIVDEVVAPDDLLAAAKKWLLSDGNAVQPWDKKGFRVPGGGGTHPATAQAFMAGNAMIAEKTQHNYPAPIAIMSCVFEGTIVPIDAGLRIESRYFTKLLMDPVYRNMTRTLFINKGAADKLVRRPKDIAPSSQVKKLGMLGAGMMGAGIAYVSARAGIDVVLLDRSDEAAEKGKDYSRKLLQKAIDRNKTTKDKADAVLARITTTTDYADLHGVDLIIEAVFESREIKADVTAKTEAVIPAMAVFASNTSTLPITGLAEASKRPESFIGLHFFSPVDKMPLVEIILGEKTSDEALAKSLDYVKQIRKTPIVVNDSRGFYTSRCFSTYTNEGMALLKDGVAPALIENAAKQAGMPVGPLAVHDEVTLELGVKIFKQTQKDLGDQYKAPSAMDVAVKFVEQLDRKGKRFGKGFYDYPEGGKKRLWPGITEHYPSSAEQPGVDEIKTRLLYIQAIESARCFEEKVVLEVADVDVGSILAWGFPPYTGGTLSFIDTIGVANFVAECDRLEAAYGERFAAPALLRSMAKAGERFYPAAQNARRKSAA